MTFDEKQVRAAAGLTMVVGAVAFAFAYFDRRYVPLQAVTAFFFVEFLIRLTAGLRYSPAGLVARALTLGRGAGVGVGHAQALRVDARPDHVAGHDRDHQQRHPRRSAPDDLPRLPDADVAGVGARASASGAGSPASSRGEAGWARLPRATHAPAAPAGPRTRRSRRWDGGSRDGHRRARAAHAGRCLPRRPSRLRATTVLDDAARLGVRGASTSAATSTSTTPAAACTPTSQVEEHLSCCARPCSATRTRSTRRRAASTALVERRAPAVLRFFGADARGVPVHLHRERQRRAAARRRGVSVRPGGRFLATVDNHNSVNGIREFARGEGAAAAYVPLPGTGPARRRARCSSATSTPARRAARNLLAFPAQSNFSGVQHPLDWIATAHERGLGRAARRRRVRADQPARLSARAPRLRRGLLLQDLRLPDRRRLRCSRGATALRRLQRPWFAAAPSPSPPSRATVTAAARRTAGFEDGTVDYLGSPPSRSACGTSSGSASTRSSARVRGARRLAARRAARPAPRRRPPGDPHPRARATWDRAAATIAFNFLHPDGRVVDERCVDASPRRTASRCGPGASATRARGRRPSRSRGPPWSSADFDDRAGIDAYLGRVGMASGGAVRVSLGIVSNFADVCRFLAFARGLP